MASKLDNSLVEIFEMLNVRALSYRQVCAQLYEQGTKISPQALRSWHIRKMSKIARRNSVVNFPMVQPTHNLIGADSSCSTSQSIRRLLHSMHAESDVLNLRAQPENPRTLDEHLRDEELKQELQKKQKFISQEFVAKRRKD